MEIKNKTIFDQLKKINPLELDKYLEDSWLLSYKEGIELTHYYIRKLINRIPVDKNRKNRWLILNDRYRDAFLSNIRIHLFRTYTGSGKTVTSVLWVKFLTQLSKKIEGFVVLSPEYKHGSDEIKKIIIKHGNHVDYVYFEGKYRLCTQKDVQINDNGLTIGMLMENGISTTKYCEKECKEYTKCVYMGNCKIIVTPINKGGIKNWIGVQHQIGYFLPIYMYHVEDIILVIDENFSDAIKEHHKYGVPLLRKNILFLNMVLKDLKLNDDKNYRYFVKEFKKLLETYVYSLTKEILLELNYILIGDILDNIDDFDDAYVNKLNEQAFRYVKNGRIPPFKFIFGEICNFIDNYEDLLESNYDDINNWMKASFYKKMEKFEISFLYYDKHKLDMLFNKDNLSKLIINDATVDKLELSYLIGDKEPVIEHNENWMYENCEFHQLNKRVNYNPKNKKTNKKTDKKYAYYPKSSFLFEKTFFYLIGNLKAILERHKDEPVLVVARDIEGKKLEFNGGIKLSDYVHTLGYSNVLFEDYPLKGTNAYSDVNVVVILGRPELPQAVIKRQSTLIGMEPKDYREIYSRTSMIQAIGRILRGNKKKYVYIITGFDLKLNRPIKSYKSHTELRNSLIAETSAIKEKKIEATKYNIILNHIKKNKFISIKDCMEIFQITKYKAIKLLEEFKDKNLLNKEDLRTTQKGRTKIIYNLKLD